VTEGYDKIEWFDFTERAGVAIAAIYDDDGLVGDIETEHRELKYL